MRKFNGPYVGAALLICTSVAVSACVSPPPSDPQAAASTSSKPSSGLNEIFMSQQPGACLFHLEDPKGELQTAYVITKGTKDISNETGDVVFYGKPRGPAQSLTEVVNVLSPQKTAKEVGPEVTQRKRAEKLYGLCQRAQISNKLVADKKSESLDPD